VTTLRMLLDPSDPLILGIWILSAMNLSIVIGYFVYAKLIEPWLDERKYGPKLIISTDTTTKEI